MNVFKTALVAFLFCSTAAMAAPASEASVKELLAVTRTQELVDGVQGQFDSLMEASVQQALKGKTPTPKQQQAIANMKNRMLALVQGELAWEKRESRNLRLYQETFTEEEIADMLTFYKTPAGQAVIQKMPVLMQKTMVDIQKTIVEMAPQMQKIRADFVAEMLASTKNR